MNGKAIRPFNAVQLTKKHEMTHIRNAMKGIALVILSFALEHCGNTIS